MMYRDAAPIHHFGEIAADDAVSAMPTDATADDLGRKPMALEQGCGIGLRDRLDV